MNSKIDFVYNPDNQSKEQLIDNFVVRLNVFQQLIKKLIADLKSEFKPQNILIKGKRGMGKTTMLLRLGYEIESNDELKSIAIPVVFNEEEYGVRRLYKLWERIASLLEGKDSYFIGLYNKMDSSFMNYESDEDYERAIFALLESTVNKSGKKLILFIDNFGDMVAKFSEKEVARFKELLSHNTFFSVIGASSMSFDGIFESCEKYFDVIRLKGLDQNQTKRLLLKLSETFNLPNIENILKNQPGKVETLRRLTGGVIRTIVLLFEIFIDQKNGSTFSDLETLLDRVTPLYKHQMDELTAQQQEIIEALAFAWDAMSTKEISVKTRIVSKSISAQLIQMEKNEIILKKLTNSKNHYYQISERFFNIWYLMRHGRKGDRKKIIWLVKFLEEWCDQKELIQRADQHIGQLKKGEYDVQGAYYLTEALASTKKLPTKNQDALIKAARKFLRGRNSDLADNLSDSTFELLEKFNKSYKDKDFNTALRYLKIINMGDGFLEGLCHYALKEYDKAEQCFLKSASNGSPHAMHQLGRLYSKELIDLEKAEKYYLDSIENGNESSYVSLIKFYEKMKGDSKKASEYLKKVSEFEDSEILIPLGKFYERDMKNNTKAIELYQKAIEKGNSQALILLADLYAVELQDYNKAEFYYMEALENEANGAAIEFALFYRNQLKQYEKAEKYFKDALEQGYVDAYFYLGVLYHTDLSDYEKAEEFYLKAIEHDSKESLHNLGNLYEEIHNDIETSMKYYEKAIKLGSTRAMFSLGKIYDVYFEDYSEAEKYYNMAIEKNDELAMNNLAYLLYVDSKTPKKALDLAKNSYNLNNNDSSRLTYAKVLLWNNEYDKAKVVAEEFMNYSKYLDDYLDYFIDFLCLLMAKNQYEFLRDYFSNPEHEELMLKDRLKPVWYALTFYMKEDLPNEFLRMGSELSETVSELVEKIEIMRKTYEV